MNDWVKILILPVAGILVLIAVYGGYIKPQDMKIEQMNKQLDILLGKGDRMVPIEKILAMDPEGLLYTVLGSGISMCGVVSTTVVLVACMELGASSAELVAYATSGDASGDYEQVVGYAGLIIR